MTDKPTKERLIAVLSDWSPCDSDGFERDEAEFVSVIEDILNELEWPGNAALKTAGTGSHQLSRWQAVVRAIREGL